ncbi:p53 and DNA damage-regulated protein 1 [Carassius auratus]|uniref:p53 and DNA damage-regulated protein 1 n=1 Tax=Carassius auratus TaxID=7957 RepID=A0A6P6MIM4_CARAU|nr:p53 and DNA damage-regulated protein 1 [Carassius auratus]XP_052425847.1 p53 and DNA damage-regulated protein 1 [Carassius gibelio]
MSRTCFPSAQHTDPSMDETAQRILEHLTEVEVAAEDILSDKQQIVDLDSRRNRNREALGALRNHSSNDHVKVCFGNMFIKFPPERTRSMILKDQEQLDKEISDLRKQLKAKVNRLNDLQGKPELRGYNLSPLSSDEIKAIGTLIKK